MTLEAAEIRSLIHHIQALRRQFCAALDGIEARLATLAGPEQSFQIPPTWDGYLGGRDGKKNRRTKAT